MSYTDSSKLNFILVDWKKVPEQGVNNTVYLEKDYWNDFGYKTLFGMYICIDSNVVRKLGYLKIGNANMPDNQSDDLGLSEDKNLDIKEIIDNSFYELSDSYFSMGHDEEYYENIMKLPEPISSTILDSLNDVIRHPELRRKFAETPVYKVSIVRDISNYKILGPFSRIVNNDKSHVKYDFSCLCESEDFDSNKGNDLIFSISPDSPISTNVHAIIGSNGVGKSYLLRKLARLPIGYDSESESFSKIVFVSFSSFESVDILEKSDSNETENIDSSKTLQIIGIFEHYTNVHGVYSYEKKYTSRFIDSIKRCFKFSEPLWHGVSSILETDVIMKEFTQNDFNNMDDKQISDAFEQLSSGHKIVIFTLTQLIELVEEKSLILFDEPEMHLHPPLLSSYINAISWLLRKRNGAAIVVTHSPVVLQEIPRSCVWIIEKRNNERTARRPDGETYGANVGALTREIFGLEFQNSGYYKHISDIASDAIDYNDALRKLGGSVGVEGSVIIQSVIAGRSSK